MSVVKLFEWPIWQYVEDGHILIVPRTKDSFARLLPGSVATEHLLNTAFASGKCWHGMSFEDEYIKSYRFHLFQKDG